MNTPAILVENLVHRYGKAEAVNGLSLHVEPGQCYGFFGRNGSGKTTTIKCLLNLLRPSAGRVELFGLNPGRAEAAVKSRLAYVPDFVAFYPWMNVREALEYQAAFRSRWNSQTEQELLTRFQLDPKQPTSGLSKGQRTQLALIGAICCEPDLLILDEPTSGLDPLVRRDFIQTIIGAYQEGAPGQRTVFLSTHLITEFEGLIDRFTIIAKGREVTTMDADEARSKYKRLRATFLNDAPAETEFKNVQSVRRQGRTIELVVNGNSEEMLARLQQMQPTSLETESLTLEEVFLITLK